MNIFNLSNILRQLWCLKQDWWLEALMVDLAFQAPARIRPTYYVNDCKCDVLNMCCTCFKICSWDEFGMERYSNGFSNRYLRALSSALFVSSFSTSNKSDWQRHVVNQSFSRMSSRCPNLEICHSCMEWDHVELMVEEWSSRQAAWNMGDSSGDSFTENSRREVWVSWHVLTLFSVSAVFTVSSRYSQFCLGQPNINSDLFHIQGERWN